MYLNDFGRSSMTLLTNFNTGDIMMITNPKYDQNGLYTNALCHYGVKGMKWGVRRSRKELKYNPSSIAAYINRKGIMLQTLSGLVKVRMTEHALERASQRKISALDISDALETPIYVEPKLRFNQDGLPSQRFVGKYATVNVNTITGDLTTLWTTGERYVRKYGKERI